LRRTLRVFYCIKRTRCYAMSHEVVLVFYILFEQAVGGGRGGEGQGVITVM